MRPDVSVSRYTEAPDVEKEFSREELRHLRLILRRLHFLEAKVRDEGGLGNPDANGGAGWAEWEIAAQEWILSEVGFLIISED